MQGFSAHFMAQCVWRKRSNCWFAVYRCIMLVVKIRSGLGVKTYSLTVGLPMLIYSLNPMHLFCFLCFAPPGAVSVSLQSYPESGEHQRGWEDPALLRKQRHHPHRLSQCHREPGVPHVTMTTKPLQWGMLCFIVQKQVCCVVEECCLPCLGKKKKRKRSL